ncbi:hypothetical protein M885DRAFT_624036 [Pelagophyceae sp. CCMP2097]|nr:hypothetical protein M885DRAFT_624036 [Pelagophyceae sp. CCMP2097]
MVSVALDGALPGAPPADLDAYMAALDGDAIERLRASRLLPFDSTTGEMRSCAGPAYRQHLAASFIAVSVTCAGSSDALGDYMKLCAVHSLCVGILATFATERATAAASSPHVAELPQRGADLEPCAAASPLRSRKSFATESPPTHELLPAAFFEVGSSGPQTDAELRMVHELFCDGKADDGKADDGKADDGFTMELWEPDHPSSSSPQAERAKK